MNKNKEVRKSCQLSLNTNKFVNQKSVLTKLKSRLLCIDCTIYFRAEIMETMCEGFISGRLNQTTRVPYFFVNFVFHLFNKSLNMYFCRMYESTLLNTCYH